MWVTYSILFVEWAELILLISLMLIELLQRLVCALLIDTQCLGCMQF